MRWYKVLFVGILILMHGVVDVNASELSNAIDAVRVECGNVAAHLNDMKKRAGINTAVTAVGTAAGGGAMGTGIARTVQVDKMSDIDAQIAELESERDNLINAKRGVKIGAAVRPVSATENSVDDDAWNAIATEYASIKKLNNVPTRTVENDTNPTATDSDVADVSAAVDATYDAQIKAAEDKIAMLKNERDQMSGRATTLGNARTGLAATSTATNVVGAVVASKNSADGDLADAIRACGNAVKNLSNIQMQARLDKSATDVELNVASRVVDACRDVDLIDASKISKRARGAMGASIAGAITGGVATITSGVAVGRGAATDKKTRDLDTTANVFSGVGTASSLTATVFNATQISAIKKASQIIDKCEEVLK